MSNEALLHRRAKNNGLSSALSEFEFLEFSGSHPDNPDIRIGWARITPTIAKRLMKLNIANRDVKTRGRSKIVEDQSSGSWNNENPDPIVIDLDGRLSNGQHRLLGVIETGVPIVVLVVIGVSPSVMETLDTGSVRSLTDTLTIENRAYGAGHKNLSYLAGCITACYRYKKRGNLSQGGGAVYTRPQLLAFYREDREWIERLVSWSISTSRKMPSTGNITTVKRLCAFRFALESAGASMDDVELFFAMLLEERAAAPAVLELRKRFQSLQVEHNRKRTPTDDLVMALMVKAWNFYLDGVAPKNLKWKAGASGGEAFPELKVVSE